MTSLEAQMVKYPSAMQETWFGSLRREDPLEKGVATHSSTLAWIITWTEEPGGLQSKSMGWQSVEHDWATNASLFITGHKGTDTTEWLTHSYICNSKYQFSSVAQSCPTLCDPMNHSTPGLPVHHQLLEFTQTHVHQIHDAIQPSHLLSSPSPSALNSSQHQSLFQWVNSSHEVAKVLEFQL